MGKQEKNLGWIFDGDCGAKVAKKEHGAVAAALLGNLLDLSTSAEEVRGALN